MARSLPLLALLLLAPLGLQAQEDDLSAEVPAPPLQEPKADPQWEAGGMVFAHYAPKSNGAASFGLRRGPLSIQYLTDTLDIRYAPEDNLGRYWAALRVEGYGAGLAFSPWFDGEPLPERALSMSYAGVEGGWIRYLPEGLYAGVEGLARAYVFSDVEATAIAVPESTYRVGANAILGVYRSRFFAYGLAGSDVVGGVVAPRVDLRGQLSAKDGIYPVLRVSAGRAWNQDIVTLTRLGGSHPYDVGLVGMGWGQVWTQQYAVARAGVGGQTKLVTAEAFADGGVYTPEADLSPEDAAALGLSPEEVAAYELRQATVSAGLKLRVNIRRMYLEMVGGYALLTPRNTGDLPLSIWAGAGWDWRPLRG